MEHLGRFNRFPVSFPLSQYAFGILLGCHIQEDFLFLWFIPFISLFIFLCGSLNKYSKVPLKTFSISIFLVWFGIHLSGECINSSKIQEIDISKPVRLMGRIIDHPKRASKSLSFYMKTSFINDFWGKREVNNNVKVKLFSRSDYLCKGDEISILIWLKKFKRRKERLFDFNGRKDLFYSGNLKNEIEIHKKENGIFKRLINFSREKSM